MPKCKHCKAPYERTQPMQVTCYTVECALGWAKSKREKSYKAETRVMRKALLDTDRAHHIKKAQTAFNAYIRARDAGLPCISCGCPDGKGKRNACHYRPAGVNTALRFDPLNVHGGCERCNTYQSGNLVGYRAGLIARIGIDAVELLDANHDIKKWTIPELKAIEAEYKAKLKALR